MRKQWIKVLVGLLLWLQLPPLASFAEGIVQSMPAAPYEKVLATEGSWFTGRPSEGNQTALTVGYTGEAMTSSEPLTFTTREEALVEQIYVTTATAETLTLQDELGNLYPGFERVSMEAESAIYQSPAEVRLPAGSYVAEGASGDFVVKGINADGQDRYVEQVVEHASSVEGALLTPLSAGQEASTETLSASSGVTGKNPAIFVLDTTYLIEEIILNTYNEGAGAQPGHIAILDGANQVVYSQQAFGGALGDLGNGLWIVKPDILLPAGTYYIGSSDPSVIGHDAAGDPLFYLTAYPTIPAPPDYTGTYRIDVDTRKTSTLMGSVSGPTSAFLRDFEMTALHKEGYIELIGEYEGMPVSQNCRIVEETENGIVALFDFDVDLTGLPYKARMGTQVMVTFAMDSEGQATVDFSGDAFYSRAAGGGEGADENTYDVSGSGRRVTTDLPPFVVTALGAAASAGNIPGADTPLQNATGILFPPLVGLVASVIQEALKKKENEKKKNKPVMRDKSWYKRKYPEATDEQLAMIMLADAMGNTDEPDEGDQISVGDNEVGESESGGFDQAEDWDESYEEEVAVEESFVDEEAPGEEKEETAEEPEAPAEEEREKEVPEPPTIEEPESMVLKTSARGAETLFVKDPDTGNWVNMDTGNEISDMGAYKSDLEKRMAGDLKVIEEQSAINREPDPYMEKAMKEVEEALTHDEHMRKLEKKYGTDKVGLIKATITQRAEQERENFEKWQTIGDVARVGEVSARVVQVGADAAIDVMGTTVPGGKYVRAGYKVAKGAAGTAADHHAKGKDWTAGAAEGFIKGSGDAAGDFIKNPYVKAVVTTTTESAGSAAGAYIRGEDYIQAGQNGYVDGIHKVVVGTITDKIVGDAPNVDLPDVPIRVDTTLKKVFTSKEARTKVGMGLTDEFGLKPNILDPAKKAIEVERPQFKK